MKSDQPNPTDYTHIRVTQDTRRKLKLAASMQDMSILALIDRLATEELARLKKEEK